MLYAKLFIIFMIISGQVFAKCDPMHAAALAEDFNTREKYGIRNDGRRTQAPSDCTPFMKEEGMIPLSKRKTAGTNRERYMDKKCNVYEWDYEKGRFEKYTMSGSKLVHQGEISPVKGVPFLDSREAGRDHDDMSTGYDGLNMKKLCREYSGNLLNPNRIRVKGLKCI